MVNAISPRYAKVLFNVDCKHGRLNGRLEDFTAIHDMLHSQPKLVRFLRARQVTLQDKKQILQDMLKERFDPFFIHFLFYLIEKRELVHLGQVEKAYTLLVNKHFNRWEADIVTAVPLDRDSEMELVKQLERVFHKKICLNKRVDPKIIGGAVLVIANEILDWSVTGRLKKLKEHLIASQV